MAIPYHHSNSAPAVSNAGPVAVGRFIAPIAGKTLSKGGTVMAGLLSQWAAIAGPSLAAYTIPVRMTSAARELPIPGKCAASMLHLKVDPAKALEVQYTVPQLVERINQALGYQAVAGIRLVQAPISNRAKMPSKPQGVLETPRPQNANRLGSALARMATGVKARSNRGSIAPRPR